MTDIAPAGRPPARGAGPALTRRLLLKNSAAVGLTGALTGAFTNAVGPAPAAAARTTTGPSNAGPVKSAATYFTPDRVAAARRNVNDFAWARAIRDARVREAAPWLAQTDEALWSAITGQGLPRSYAVNEPLGSPTSGTKIYDHGRQPWKAQPFQRPWKLTDPVSGHVFPTNDFAKFYASALDEHGQFRRELGDPAYLVNELYPEKGPGWGVDDGFGWVDDDGNKWTFIAYYNFFLTWFAVTTAPSVIWAGLVYLRDAFVLTGDLAYAHKGLILLDRVADVFPSLDTGAYRREDGYLVSDGLSRRGKVTGRIWDCDLFREILSSYDAFYPAIADDDRADVVPFLSEQARRYGLPAKDSTAAIRANIENNLFRETFAAVRAGQIYGNFGMHQSTLAWAAVVLDDPDTSRQWIDWIFQSGGVVTEPKYHVTGGDVHRTLVEQVDRNGFGNEGSLQYQALWIGQFAAMTDVLSKYQRYPSADLYAHPKARKLFTSRHQAFMLNRYTPGIGDTGRTGMPDLFTRPDEYVALFERYGDPQYAQVAHLLGHGDVDNLHGGLYSTDVAGTQQRIRDIVQQHGPLQLPSVDLTGVGFAALRTGSGQEMRGLWRYYGRNSGHGHADALNLGIYGYGVDLAPDLGYPESADGSAREVEWNKNTIAHNTVVVDAGRQRPHTVGRSRGFAVTDRVQMFDHDAPEVYPQASAYRRVTAMVDAGDGTWYAVDVFRVVGGRDHHYSFHGAEGPVTTDGLTLVGQPTGSYAGPDLDPPADKSKPRPGASGFDWLSNVERDQAPGDRFSVDWAVTDTWDVHPDDIDLHLRLTMLGQVDDVALADGTPARNQPGNPAKLRYLIAHRRGDDGLASQFTGVLEPYVGQRRVRSLTLAPVRVMTGTVADHEVAAVKVQLVDGRVDYVVSCAVPDALLRVDDTFMFRGAFGVYSMHGGKPVYACSHDATLLGPLPHLQSGFGALSGRLTDFTRTLTRDNRLFVQPDTDVDVDPATLVGGYAHVAGSRNPVYEITAAGVDNAGRLVLDIGDTTPIRGYQNPGRFDAGFEYDIKPGAVVRIPLTREWTP